jgi:hypothetical protein
VCVEGVAGAEDKVDSGSASLLMKLGQLFSLSRWVSGTPYIYMLLKWNSGSSGDIVKKCVDSILYRW